MKKANNRGFTILELMVVIAIIAIMAALAVPNYLSWLPDRRLATGALDVLQGLQKSRSEAIKSNRNVIVTFNPGAESFRAFMDADASGAQNGSEPTIINRSMPAGIDLVSTGFTANSVTFDSRGIPTTAVGLVTLQNSKGNTQRVELFLSGHSVLQ